MLGQIKTGNVRVYVIEIINTDVSERVTIRRVFANDYPAFVKAINKYYNDKKFKIDFIGYYEVEEKTMLNTYNAIINSTITENLIPETVVNETMSFLFLFYKRCNLHVTLNLHAPAGRFLWGDQ
jgi:hypothetical protein